MLPMPGQKGVAYDSQCTSVPKLVHMSLIGGVPKCTNTSTHVVHWRCSSIREICFIQCIWTCCKVFTLYLHKDTYAFVYFLLIHSDQSEFYFYFSCEYIFYESSCVFFGYSQFLPHRPLAIPNTDDKSGPQAPTNSLRGPPMWAQLSFIAPIVISNEFNSTCSS